ncbi:CASP-like protein 4A3 isoform X1 [Solanum stenotomum]|uniref:CASP-like protein 4A3 isoform X1 n=1 Tax=Solanum stenotomum TaxID=172797 RepID=UPI0020D0D09E|nr:CASP-like protein 4A3 isoform X1 [Solanum stenotomum]
MEKSNSNSSSTSNSNHHRNFPKHNSHLSMSDTDSQVSQMDSFHSPLRFESLLCSDDPLPDHRATKSLSSKALVSVEKYYSPVRSPHKLSLENLSSPPTPTQPSEAGNKDRNSQGVYFSRPGREDVTNGVTKVGPVRGGDVEGGEMEGERPPRTGRSKRELTLTRAALGFRVCEFVLCLISFSVMAADKTEGWSGDSFDRYKEYRYCVAVNAIGFAYSGIQVFDLIYNLASRKHFLSHYTRYHFDFLMDQILAYLIMSASSSAATRAYDWISNWGKDEFTEMASASIGVSFLAFTAFAFSSLISGYNFCNRNAS